MKRIPGILSWLLVLVFAFTTCVTDIYAEATAPDVDESDVQISDEAKSDNYGVYSEAIKALFRFDILDETTFMPKENVKRGDFIVKAMKITGMGSGFKAVDTDFADVKADNPDSGAIAAAVDMEFINGYGNGNFGPNDILTNEQVVKILVSVLGYDAYANACGGYPSGYLSVAAMQGLLKNVKIGDYEQCTWDEAAQLIFNAMNTDILQSATYPEKRYFSNEGENPMTKWMGIYLHKGTVTANSITSLTGKEGTRSEAVDIDNIQYEENGTNASKYLGYPVEAYYSINNNANRVLMYVKANSKVKEVCVDTSQIDDKTTATSFYWFEEENSKSYRQAVSTSAVVIYNGKHYEPADGELSGMLKPMMGSVRLVDTTGNGEADLIFINDEVTYVVKMLMPGRSTINDKYNQPPLVLEPGDEKIDVRIIKNGEEIGIDQIKINNVLTVTRSKDGKFINIVVCSDKIKGTVQEKSDDSIVINDKEYKFVKSNADEFDKISVGNKSVFYISADGKAAGFGEAVSAHTYYGYLINGGINMKGVSDGNEAQLRIFTTDGTVKQYKVSEKVSVNGKRTNAQGQSYKGKVLFEEIMITRLDNGYEDGGQVVFRVSQPQYKSGDEVQLFYCNQLIKFTVDSEDLITEIKTANDNRKASNGTGEASDEFSCDYSFHSDTKYASYKSFGFIQGLYRVTGTTGIKVPHDNTWYKYYNGEIDLPTLEKHFSVFSPSEIWPTDYRLHHVDIYDVTESRDCSVIVEKPKSKGTIGTETPALDCFVVDRVADTLDENGCITKKVFGFYKNQETSWELAQEVCINEADVVGRDAALATLRQGDVLRVTVSGAGEITAFYTLFSLKKRDGYILNGTEFNDFQNNSGDSLFSNYINVSVGTWNTSYNIVHGKITSVDGTTLTVRLGESEDGQKTPLDRLMYYQSKHIILVFDEEKKIIRKGTVDDIQPDNPRQTAVIRNRYFEPYEIILVNRKSDPQPIYWMGRYAE